jgi:hypothetical protein
MAIPAERAADAAGHPRTDDADGGAGCDVEHDDVGRVELVEGVDPHAGDHLAAELLERRDHRRTDRGGAALGDRPPVGVRGGGERDPDRRGHRGGQVAQGVCGDPPNSARASSLDHARASTDAGRLARAPNRASATGWAGTRTIGRRKSAAILSNCSVSGPNTRRHLRPSLPRAAAVPVTDRRPTPPRPPSRGWVNCTSGQRQVSPCRARSNSRENGVSRPTGGTRSTRRGSVPAG